MTEPNMDLSGRTALITGAGRHTGRAFSRALAARGATVHVNDIDRSLAEKVCEEIAGDGGQAAPAVFDITDFEAVAAAVGAVAPDILVNNAGGTDAIDWPAPNFHETDPASWRHFVDVNFYGVLNCTHAALPAMQERGWGRIITMVSDSARRGERGIAVYAGAKAAGAGFMRSIAAEYGRDGITSNAISLGTLAYEHLGQAPEEMVQRMLKPYQIKRQGRPSDPVGVLLMLASDAGEWITGQVIPVNGGYSNAL